MKIEKHAILENCLSFGNFLMMGGQRRLYRNFIAIKIVLNSACK